MVLAAGEIRSAIGHRARTAHPRDADSDGVHDHATASPALVAVLEAGMRVWSLLDTGGRVIIKCDGVEFASVNAWQPGDKDDTDLLAAQFIVDACNATERAREKLKVPA